MDESAQQTPELKHEASEAVNLSGEAADVPAAEASETQAAEGARKQSWDLM
jgi:hypothetical protein